LVHRFPVASFQNINHGVELHSFISKLDLKLDYAQAEINLQKRIHDEMFKITAVLYNAISHSISLQKSVGYFKDITKTFPAIKYSTNMRQFR